MEKKMKRRSFFGAGSAAIASGLIGAHKSQADSPVTVEMNSDKGRFTLKTFQNIRSQYLYDFNDFLTFYDKFVVDRQYGGFLCSCDHDGTHINTNKTATTEGRGIWCYSFMYNNGLVKNKKYLDYARASKDFIMKFYPGGDNYFPSTWSQDGKIIDEKGNLPGDCYIGEGLRELSLATNDPKMRALSKEIMLKCYAKYNSPDFKDGSSPYPGARNLWYWMEFMWFGINWLVTWPDPEWEKIVNDCIEAMMERHLNPEFNLWNMVINHDLSRASGENEAYAKVAACGHTTEALWMIMYEAVRRKDKKLFENAASMFKRHVEVSRDHVYGGVFDDCKDVDQNIWMLTKILWAEVFVLIGSLQVIEHIGSPWATDMFAEQYDYCLKKLTKKQYGYSLWFDSTDRKGNFPPHASRADIYHHPRHLMLNLLSLERIIKRGGKLSGVFA
jgi:N-acylglucosamine 2-epimerase